MGMCAVSSVDKYSSTNGAPCEWLVLSSITAATAKNSGGGKICATIRWASSVSVRYELGCLSFLGKIASDVFGIDEQTGRCDIPKEIQKKRKDVEAKCWVRVELANELGIESGDVRDSL